MRREAVIRLHTPPTSCTSRQDRPGQDIFHIQLRSTSRRSQQQTRRMELCYRRRQW
jgi:hypothetical protein